MRQILNYIKGMNKLFLLRINNIKLLIQNADNNIKYIHSRLISKIIFTLSKPASE